MDKLVVLDAVMGSGKSQRLIDMVNKSDHNQKFIYVGVMLDECHRFAGTSYEEDDEYKRPICSNSDVTGVQYVYDQNNPLSNRFFKHPDYIGGNKEDNLVYLVNSKRNISTTHQLFRKLSVESVKLCSDYILIIDEAISVFDYYTDISQAEILALIKKEILYVLEDGFTLQFNRDNFGRGDKSVKDTHYENLAELCDIRCLSLLDGKHIIWKMPIDLIKSFKEVWVATYRFEGSVMSSYLKSHNIPYKVEKFGLKPQDFIDLINVVGLKENTHEELLNSTKKKINFVGNKFNSLSSTNYSNDCNNICVELSTNLDNFRKNITKSKSDNILWTTFKKYKDKVSGRNFRKNWLPFNTKATNNYSDVKNMAYLLNIYPLPAIKRMCYLLEYPMDENNFALCEMIQWIWRGNIRKGGSVNLYVPSFRMRKLLIDWLNEE